LEKRFKKIIGVLSAYCGGDFGRKLSLSDNMDDVDAIASGIHMLGDELKNLTISRDYFTNIFHSVSDMVFILDRKGNIIDLNHSVYDQLGYSRTQLMGRSIRDLCAPGRNAFSMEWLKYVKGNQGFTCADTFFRTAANDQIPVDVSATLLTDSSKGKIKILLTAKDNTVQLHDENTVMRAIINAQENERYRVAKDMHDSLGQKLSAIKFYIGALKAVCNNKEITRALSTTNTILTQAIAGMRDICFDLVPSTLGEFGLFQALMEFCWQPVYQDKIRLFLQKDERGSFPILPKDVGTDIFRVIQEFVSNALEHGGASKVSIRYGCHQDRVLFFLKDNGRGFNTDGSFLPGRGMQNIHSRIKSHDGEVSITSAPGKGTVYKLMVPNTRRQPVDDSGVSFIRSSLKITGKPLQMVLCSADT
jgi:PAS domain S-box-containing protein